MNSFTKSNRVQLTKKHKSVFNANIKTGQRGNRTVIGVGFNISLRVCLSDFSELETGDKQAFDTHNQNADTNTYTNPFLGRRVYRPVSGTSSRGYNTSV